jgi:hypothetical protein
VNIAPTPLGLKLYARCRGDAELPETLQVPSALEMAS